MRPGTRMLVGAAGIALLIAGGLNQRSGSVTAQPATAVRAARPAAAPASGQQATEARQDAREDVLTTGEAARRARAAAEAALPGATTREIERGSDGGGGGYEVELVRPDGSTVDVRLDDHFRVVWIGR
jgi:uncharacterized membrane protein YkoI